MALQLETIISIAIFFAVFALIRRIRSKQLSWSFLAAGSLFLYGWWWSWLLVGVLLGCAALSYLSALAIDRWPARKLWLAIASFAAHVALFVAIRRLDPLYMVEGFRGSAAAIGLSFYGLQSASYVVDVYRGEVSAARNPIRFLAYLSLFPKLAGPIVRAKELFVELDKEPRPSTRDERWEGLVLITQGIALKTIVAASVGNIFGKYQGALLPSGPAMWMWALLVTIYVFCDLAGYCKIAAGLCRWMGLPIAPDFKRPFGATSFNDFWSRFYISASSWFRDYIGKPISNVIPGAIGRHVATLVAFIAFGAWFGSDYSHLLWGFAWGVLLVLEDVSGWSRHLSKLPGGRAISAFIVGAVFIGLTPFLHFDGLDYALPTFEHMIFWEDLQPILLQSWVNVRDPMIYTLIFGAVALYFLPDRFTKRLAESRIGYHLAPVLIAVVLVASIFARGKEQLWPFRVLTF